MEILILLVPALPILSALLTWLFAGSLGRQVARISVAGTLLAFLLAAATLWHALGAPAVQSLALFGTPALLLLDPLLFQRLHRPSFESTQLTRGGFGTLDRAEPLLGLEGP